MDYVPLKETEGQSPVSFFVCTVHMTTNGQQAMFSRAVHTTHKADGENEIPLIQPGENHEKKKDRAHSSFMLL